MNINFLNSKRSVIITTIVFIIFLVVVLPFMSNQLNNATSAASSPDTSFIYSSDDLYEMASAYGSAGRKMYVIQRVTFDIIWPIVYGSFIYSVIGYGVTNYLNLKRFHFLKYVPFIAVGFDYLENIFASIVFIRFPLETFIIAQLTPVATLLKWIYVGGGMLLAIILLVYIIIRRPNIDI